MGWASVAAQGVTPSADGIGGRDDPGLRRLESVLAKQLDRGKDALPLPWRETILKPDTARLVWLPRSLPSPAGEGGFRVAIDPPTHWYYIAWAGSVGTPLTLYGPLEEGAKGVFVDALAATAATAATAPQAAAGGGEAGSQSRNQAEAQAQAQAKIQVEHQVEHQDSAQGPMTTPFWHDRAFDAQGADHGGS